MVNVTNLTIGLVSVGVVAFVSIFCGCFSSAFWVSDSLQYLRCAENLKHVAGGSEWVGEWFATWPIGYPAAIAIVSGCTGLDAFVASKVLGVLATGGLLFIFYRYFRSLFPVLALSLLNLAYLKTVRGTQSEQLFFPLIVLLMCVSRRILPLCILFVGLFLVRYVGVFAPIWLMVGLAVSGEREKSTWRNVSIATCLAWGIEVAYLVVNKLGCGSFTGMARDTLRTGFGEFVRDVCAAEFHEFQAYGLLLFWAVILLMLCGGGRAEKSEDLSPRRRQYGDWRSWVGAGVAYHLTMIVMRYAGSCSQLGYRFLHPGTLLIVIGLCLRFGDLLQLRKVNLGWARSLALVCIVFLVGLNLLDAELEVRRLLGMSLYGKGRPYLEIRKELLEKYRNVKSGELIHLKGLCDEDLPIIYLRPDLRFDFPAGAKRY